MNIDPIAREAAAALKDAAAGVEPPEITAVQKARRRRSGIGVAAIGFAATIAIIGVVAVLSDSDKAVAPGITSPATVTPQDTVIPSQPGVTASIPDPDWLVWSDNEQLTSVAYPPEWTRAQQTLTGFRDPQELISVASFPLDADLGSCGPFPWQAVVEFPGDGAFVTLREKFSNVRPGESAVRPAVFGPELDPIIFPEGDCLDNTIRGEIGTARWFTFEDQGRHFEALVVIGAEASSDLATQAWLIINSLVTMPRPSTAPPPSLNAIFEANVFVIDTGDGPEVCGVVMDSLPPQCGGPALDGLDWALVPWAETAQGTTWADMYIQVTFAEGRLELVTTPTESKPVERRPVNFGPPCNAPEGGWVFSPGPATSDSDLSAAMAYIQAQPDRSGAWVFNLDESPSEFEPIELVLVATFTGDLARHEAAITDLWGGPLCVTEGRYQESDLRAIQDELVALPIPQWGPGIVSPTGFSVSVTEGVVEIDVLIATEEGQRWMDERYGEGVVRLIGQLQPLPGTS